VVQSDLREAASVIQVIRVNTARDDVRDGDRLVVDKMMSAEPLKPRR
jgi:hypothetical protein